MVNIRKKRKRRLLKKLAIGFAAFVLILGITGWFARGWLAERARAILDAKLEKAGVFVSYVDPQLSLSRGLELSDVTLFEDEERTRPVFRLADLAASVSIKKLLKERNLGGEVTSSGGDFTFWHEGAERTIHDLAAIVKISPGSINLEQADCRMRGLRLELTGKIPLPESSKDDEEKPDTPPKPKEKKSLKIDLSPLAKAYDALDVRPDAELPRAVVHLEPREAGSQDLRIAVSLEGAAFSFEDKRFEKLELEGAYDIARGEIGFSKLIVDLGHSAVSATGGYVIETGLLLLPKASGRLDLAKLVAEFAPDSEAAMKTFAVTKPLSFSGEKCVINTKEPTKSSGDLTIDSPGSLSIATSAEPLVIQPFNTRLTAKDSKFELAETELQTLGGRITVQSNAELQEDEKFSYTLSTSGSGVALQEIAKILGIKRTLPGHVAFGFNAASTDLSAPIHAALKARATEKDVVHATVSTNGSFEPSSGVVRIGKIAGSADLTNLVTAFAPESAESMKPLSLSKPLDFAGEKCVVHTREFAKSTGSMSLKSPGQVSIAAGGKPIVIEPFQTKFNMRNGLLELAETQLQTLGGNLTVKASTPLESEEPRFTLISSGSGLSIYEIDQALRAEATLKGRLAFGLNAIGGTSFESIEAAAKLRVTQGHLYTIPFVGTFRNFLRTFSPKLKSDVASDLNGSLALKNGVLTTNDLLVESEQTKVSAKGGVDLVESYMKMDVLAKFKGVVGLATAAVSKALEIRGEGPLSDVKWGLKNELANGALGATVDALETGRAAVETGQKVLGEANRIRPGILIKKKKEQPQ